MPSAPFPELLEAPATSPKRGLFVAVAIAWSVAFGLLAPTAEAAEVGIAKAKLYEKSARAAQGALAYYRPLDRPEERTRVNEIGYRIAAQTDYVDFPFSFYVVDMPVPNAFALPGGHIFVTRGMLDLDLSDDMLANLLGHEIAHVIHEHGTKIQRRATLLNILSQAALIGVMVGVDNEPANTQDPYGIRNSPSRKGSLVQGTAATGIVFTELLLRDYSRGFEDEADIEGQRLAAAAGYDPDGARALWQLMLDRIPTSEDYGYWRTHPFSDQRLRAAEVRARDLKIQESPKSSEAYRAAAQAVILDFRENLEADETPEEAEKRRQERQRRSPEARLERDETPDWQKDLGTFLELSALEAWPSGETAEELRLARLHRLRDREMDRREVARDYGALAEAYEQQIEEVRRLTPKSTFLATLEKELGDLRTGADQVFPKAVEIWSSGIYQTPFLETFLSNFPAADQVPEVALALGNAYSRVRREADAVTYFLRAREAGPETEAGRRALAGLRNLTPVLEELVALQQLADAEDPELAGLAAKRLKEMAGRFETLQNGAEFLTAYPESPHGLAVKDRLEKLAQNLYGEVVLYQELGDSVKALERIQKILEFAPATTAAEALREKAVLVDA